MKRIVVQEEFTTPNGEVVPAGATIEVVEKNETPKKRIKREKRKMRESRGDAVFMVVYVNAMHSSTVVLDEVTANNLKGLRDKAYEELKAQDPDCSDDFWIDQLWCEGDLPSLDWKEVLAPHGYLDQDRVDAVFEEPEDFPVKITALKDHGYDIDEYLDSVRIFDASGEGVVDGRYGIRFPEDFVYENAEDFCGQDSPIIQNWGYFEDGWANYLSDGGIFGWVDDYFYEITA